MLIYVCTEKMLTQLVTTTLIKSLFRKLKVDKAGTHSILSQDYLE